jgi:hypothetical protein
MLFDVVISTALIFGTEPWFAFIVSIVKHHGKSTSKEFFSEIETSLEFQCSFQLAEMSTADSIKPVLNANLPTEINGRIYCFSLDH